MKTIEEVRLGLVSEKTSGRVCHVEIGEARKNVRSMGCYLMWRIAIDARWVGDVGGRE